ncbi:MAG: class I SAM-dependent methyltransferase [Vicinamibacterales bacterium]|nr:class I SAM-dependent methyltransferase [Vicinamibacterales bacterium]
MSESHPRFWPLFFELYEGLPRQGPGNRASAARALALCTGLPSSPDILDLGCGGGAQTLYLADLTAGSIVAIDSHAPLVERLRARIADQGLSGRVRALVGDMADPGQPAESFDLIWSEGALYNIGIDRAMQLCHRLLRPGGFVAFTDAVWRTDHPPAAVRASFECDYPTMGPSEAVIATVTRNGLDLRGHFTLPDQAWWDEFYTPMERRIAELRVKYADDTEAIAVLDQLAQEPEMHRRNADCYAYEFFVARRGRP